MSNEPKPWQRWRVFTAVEYNLLEEVLNTEDDNGWDLHKIFYRSGRYDLVFQRKDHE